MQRYCRPVPNEQVVPTYRTTTHPWISMLFSTAILNLRNFNVFFYFPRRTSIGAICLLHSLKNLYKELAFSSYYFEEIMQSAYCSRFQKIKNLYQPKLFSNYYFEEINFNVFFYFPRRTSIGAICILQSLPKNQEFVPKNIFCQLLL